MIGHVQEQPWNRAGSRRINFGGRLGRDLAAIVVFPGRSAKVFPENFALFVVKQRVGSLKNPGRLAAAVGATDVYLKTPGVGQQQKFCASWRGDQIRHRGIFHGTILASVTRAIPNREPAMTSNPLRRSSSGFVRSREKESISIGLQLLLRRHCLPVSLAPRSALQCSG